MSFGWFLSQSGFRAKALAFVVLVWVAFFAAPYTNLYFLWLCFFGSLAAVAIVTGFRTLRGVSAELVVEGGSRVIARHNLPATIEELKTRLKQPGGES